MTLTLQEGLQSLEALITGCNTCVFPVIVDEKTKSESDRFALCVNCYETLGSIKAALTSTEVGIVRQSYSKYVFNTFFIG